MRTTFSFTHLLGIVVLGAVALAITGCQSKVTKANFDKIEDGMTIKQVEKILGEGTQHGDGSGVAAQFGVDVGVARGGNKGQMFTWESDKNTITVHFVDGMVKSKSFK
jgi:hypothetical protein